MKAALVTGGAKRVGRAIALKLAENGYDILLHYNSSQAEAEQTANDIRAHGVKCELAKADLSDSKQVEALAQETLRQFPHWNVIINNAAIFERGTFADSSPELVERHMAINYQAPFLLTQLFTRMVKKGHIINMLDAFIAKGSHGFFTYLQSKLALTSFTTAAADELPSGFQINGICPGIMLTSNYHDASYVKDKTNAMMPGTEPTPEKVAELIVQTLNDPDITGQLLFLDGEPV